MPITEILQKNADFYPNDVSLIEINPQIENQSRMTWREYSLIEANPNEACQPFCKLLADKRNQEGR